MVTVIKAPTCPCGPEAKLRCICCVKCNTHTCMGKKMEWEICDQPPLFCYTKVHVQAATKSKSIEKGCMNNTFVPTAGADNSLTWIKPIRFNVMSDIKCFKQKTDVCDDQGEQSVILQWTWYACRDKHYCNGAVTLKMVLIFHVCVASAITLIHNILFT
uniref:Uncharacterized protein n=1 Tax=Romanomermis culicivorax TaxID=13658 RepID=A0A915HPI8_ROMCU